MSDFKNVLLYFERNMFIGSTAFRMFGQLTVMLYPHSTSLAIQLQSGFDQEQRAPLDSILSNGPGC